MLSPHARLELFTSIRARAIAEDTPVLLLLRSDFRASERALADLKKQGRTVVVSLKETGLHQIAQQLCNRANYRAS